jgi:cell wall-associated NlpC family hydrolase
MATPLAAAEHSRLRRLAARARWTPGRRGLLLLTAVLAVLVGTLPAEASPQHPTSSAEAAALVAAKSHDLEVLSEQYNTAREQLAATKASAQKAVATLKRAQASLGTAQQHVRGIARSAYTGSNLTEFQAMLTSGSADEFVDRVGTLQTIAGHQNAVLDQAASANVTAAQAQAAASRAAAEAQKQFDTVSAQQAKLKRDIANYRAAFDQLSGQEQRAAVAAAGAPGVTAASRATRTTLAPAGPIVASSQAAQIAVDTAMAQRGKPYIWAAAGPGSFDCSGLVQFAYAAAGVGLPHSSRMQSQMGTPVSRDQLQPGDLVFFYSPVSHVGIYVGNGMMVHAPTSGDVVRVANIDSMGGYNTARRLG